MNIFRHVCSFTRVVDIALNQIIADKENQHLDDPIIVTECVCGALRVRCGPIKFVAYPHCKLKNRAEKLEYAYMFVPIDLLL